MKYIISINRKRLFYSLKQSWVLPFHIKLVTKVDRGNWQVGLQIINIIYCKYFDMAFVIIVLHRCGRQMLLASAFWMKEGKTIRGHLKKNPTHSNRRLTNQTDHFRITDDWSHSSSNVLWFSKIYARLITSTRTERQSAYLNKYTRYIC